MWSPSRLPLDLLQQNFVLHMSGNPELDATLQVGSHGSRVEGRISPLDLLPTLLLMQPRIHLAFQAARPHCQLMSSLLGKQATFVSHFLPTSNQKLFSCRFSYVVYHILIIYLFVMSKLPWQICGIQNVNFLENLLKFLTVIEETGWIKLIRVKRKSLWYAGDWLR